MLCIKRSKVEDIHIFSLDSPIDVFLIANFCWVR